MELRQRSAARRDAPEAAPLRDVALGPTVYAGERFGKMSERLKRQHRSLPDVNQTANKLMKTRLIALGIALFGVFCVIMWLQYQATQRRNRRKGV
ncbi:hypothetical protein PINS_up010880 [Pythium insidiosum]|nr:hypothetical protein PINS_up010880 [Pythium insidiosum]